MKKWECKINVDEKKHREAKNVKKSGMLNKWQTKK